MDATAIFLERGVMGAGIVMLAGALVYVFLELMKSKREHLADVKAGSERLLLAAEALKQAVEVVALTKVRGRNDQQGR